MPVKMIKQVKYFYYLLIFRYIGLIFPKYIASLAFDKFTTPVRHYPKARDKDLLSQSTLLYEIFENNQIVGYKFGSGKKVIILVHGWSAHALAMRAFIPELLIKGYSVIAFDAPAHGRSHGTNLNALTYIKFLQEIFLKYRPYGVIAHSIGGTSTLFAVEKSGLANKVIKKIIIVSSPSGVVKPIEHYLRDTKLPESVRNEFYKIVYKVADNDKDMLSFLTKYPEGLHHSWLLIYDNNDTVVPVSNGEELNSVLPDSKLMVTDKLGHLKILKSNLIIEEAINYLNEDLIES